MISVSLERNILQTNFNISIHYDFRLALKSSKILLVIVLFIGFVKAQIPTHFPPFLPQPGLEESQARKIIQQICYDYARFKNGVYLLPKGEEIQQRVLSWLSKSGIEYQVEYPQILISGRKQEAIFSNILETLWQDLNQDDIPDIISKTDAWPIREPYAGGTRMNGLYLDRTGVLFKSDSIQIPVADSVEISFGFQGSPGSSITTIIKTPASSFIKDFTCVDSASFLHKIRMPLQKNGESWCSIQLISASSPQARTFLQSLSLRIPESEQFILSAPDTLQVEGFGFLNFRPEFISQEANVPLKATILEGPKWLNTDEKGYLFGRATCPPDLYPVKMLYTALTSGSKSREISFLVKVFLVELPAPPPVTQKIDSAEQKTIPSALTQLKDPVVESKPVSRGKRKKGSKNNPVSKPLLARESAPLPIQANLIQGENPSQHIRYSVQKDGYVSLTILNQSGDTVKTLFRYQKYMQGLYNIFWDGSNDAGESLARGEYECKMEFLPVDGTPPHSETCRVLKVF